MWSAKAIIYNVNTRTAIAVNYSCAMSSNGHIISLNAHVTVLIGEFSTHIGVVPFFPGFFGG